MSCTAQEMVNQAHAWLGKKESDGSFKEIIDTYNSHKPLARGYKLKYTDAWCDGFVSACAIKCGATDIIGTEIGVEKHVDIFKKMGIWYEDEDNFVPRMGDIIVFDWQDTSGSKDNKGWSDHIGIVESVSGSTIVTIEGNYNDSVKRRTMTSRKNLRGFARPNYKASSTPKPTATTTPTKKPISDIAKEVVAGAWGNGQTRITKLKAAGYDYYEVQAEVNKLLKKNVVEVVTSHYTVVKGDTLWSIAQRKLGAGQRYTEIKILNGLKSDVIRIGQVLKIPTK